MSVYETSITNPKKQLEFYKDLSEQLQQENCKLHHYKLLYQKVKDRNDKAIEYINIVAMATNKPQYFQKLKETIWGEELLEILKSNIEEVSNEIK